MRTSIAAKIDELLKQHTPDGGIEDQSLIEGVTTTLLTDARYAGEVPFEAISDETRPSKEWNTYENISEFISNETSSFLYGYRTNRQSGQPHHIECVLEKNTLLNVCENVCRDTPDAFALSSKRAKLACSQLNACQEREQTELRQIASVRRRLGLKLQQELSQL